MRRVLIAAVFVLIAALGYGSWWFAAAEQVKAGFARWAEERRAAGWTVDYVLTIGGFPFSLTATLDSPRIIAETGKWRWQGPRIVSRAAPWRPSQVTVEFPGNHVVAVPSDAPEMLVTAMRARGVGSVSVAGALEEIDAEIADITLRDPESGVFRAARITVRASQTPPEAQQEAGSPSGPPGPTLAAEITHFALPETIAFALGPTLQRAAINAQLMGRIPPGLPLREALAAWRDGGGTLEIRELAGVWGPLDITGQGTATLDNDMQPIFSFSARVRGYGETIDALVHAGLMPDRFANTAKIALGLLARPAAEDGRPQLTVPVTAQNGRVFAGPIGLFSLPRVDW